MITFPPYLYSSQAELHSLFSLSPPISSEDREIGTGGYGQSTFLLLLLPPQREDCSHSSPDGTAVHELQCASFLRALVLHKLLWHRSLLKRKFLQEQTALCGFPHGVTSLFSKPAPGWPPLSIGCQVPTRSMGFPQGHGHLWTSTFSSMRSSMSWRWICAPQYSSLGCRAHPASPCSSPQSAGESQL